MSLRVSWTCWNVLAAIIGQIKGAMETCSGPTLGTLGAAGIAGISGYQSPQNFLLKSPPPLLQAFLAALIRDACARAITTGPPALGSPRANPMVNVVATY